MADKDLNIKIGVDLEVDEKAAAKKLENVAKKLGTSGSGLLKDLNIEINLTNIEIVEEKLWSIISLVEGVGDKLTDVLSENPGGRSRLLAQLREELDLAERSAGAKQLTSAGKSGKQISLEDALSKEIFGKKGVKFNVGSYISKIDARIKTWSEDFGDDAVDSIDLISASINDALSDLNSRAKDIAKNADIKFKNADKTAIDFLNVATPEDAELLIRAIKKVNDGFKLTAKELDVITNFNLNDNDAFTISPAMLAEAYDRVIEKYGANLVINNPAKLKGSKNEIEALQGSYEKAVDQLDKLLAVKGTEWFDQKLVDEIQIEIESIRQKISNALLPKHSNLTFDSLYETVGQASEDVRAYFERMIQGMSAKKGGDSKIEAKFANITDKVIETILEKARVTGERTLREKGNGFNRRMLDEYAPAADIKDAAGGSEDTVNLLRYAQEKAAAKVRELEHLYGLAEGTVASYVYHLSKAGEESIKVFDKQAAAIALLTTSFQGPGGDNELSGIASGTRLFNVKPIFDQVADNPAMLEKLINVSDSAMQKKIEKLVEEVAGELGRSLDPSELQEIYYIALIQSLEGQIRYTAINPQEEVAKLADEIKSKTASLNSKQKAIDDAFKEYQKAQARYLEAPAGDASAATRVAAQRAQAKLQKARIEKDSVIYQIQALEARVSGLARTSSTETKADSKKENAARVMAARDLAEDELRKEYGKELAKKIAIARESGQKLEFSYEEFRKAIAKRAEEMLAGGGPLDKKPATETVAAQPVTAATPATPTVTEQPVVAEAAKTQSWIQKLAEIVGKAKADFDAQGGVLMAALDTEFNPALQQAVSELSLNIMTASGKVVDLLSFIHIPFDKEALALEKSKTGAKSVQDLMKRAQDMGLDMSKLGDIEDKDKNFEQLRAKVNALVSVLSMLDSLGVGLTGSNFKGAERANITKLIEYVNRESEARGLGTFQVPRSLDRPFDSVTEFKKAASSSKEISLVTEGGKVAGLGTLIANIVKFSDEFPGFLDQFRDVFRMTEQGPQVLGQGGKPLPAHYAQADVVMSQIVKAFFDRYAGSNNRVNQIIDGVKPSKPAAPSSPSGGGSDGGGPPLGSSSPIDNRPPSDLTGYFHSTREMEEQLASRKSLTEDERFLIEKKLELLKKDADQVATAKQLVDVQTKIAELRTADAIKARSLASKDFTPSERDQTRASFIGPLENKPNVQAARDYNELQEQEMALLRIGRARESQTINEVLELGRFKDMQEQVRQNTRKQIDAEAAKAQAGKQFSAQIKSQLKSELEAQKALQKANREQMNQWVTGRYALYDVGNFYQNVAQQMFRLNREIFNATQVFRSFETAFTSVERAMQLPNDAAVDMRNQFVRLSEVLPVTFEDLSRIATLGAQMGIGAGGIKDFTSTVARFSAITTISADTVAQKFGRIAELANIDSSQFENLGSAVAFAGVNAVATETEILTLSESIAAVSEMAGFMPSETIGMATALASVGIQAEQARGVFTRVFADIDRSVSKGGSELDAFAKVSGMSSEDFAKQWGTEGQSYQVFRKLLGGLGSSADATKAFDALNIVETREINTLIRLAENLNVVDQAVSDSNESFADATFLASSFGKTADNLDAQLVIFKNNIDSLVVSITQSLGPGLAWTLEKASGFLEVLKSASKSGAAQVFLPLALAITGIGAGFAATAAGISKMIAQIYAFRVANINSMNSSATEITSFSGKVKQLTGAYSDLIEVRSGLSGAAGPDVRGTITPINYNARDIFAGQRAAFADFIKNRDFASARQIMNSTRENALLQNANILMISANEKQGVSIALARQQADAIQRIIDARRQEIAALAQKGALEGVSEAQMLAEKFYVEITQQGAVAVSASEVAKLKETAANNTLAVSERQLATARLANIKAVNAETATATRGARMGMTGVLNRATGILGFVGIVATAVSMVDMLRVSIEEANKLDLMASGGGVQSLRDAMAEDTKVWRETGKALSTVQVEYTAFEKVTYDAYDAIISVAGANDKLKESTNEVTEVVKSQTVAIGENTKNWILNSIIGNEKVNEWLKSNPGLFNDAEAALQSYGTSFSKLINNILKNPTEGLTSAIAQIDGSLDALQRRAQKRLDEFYRNNADAGSSNNIVNPDDDPVLGPFIARIEAQKAGLKGIKTLLKELATAIRLGLDTSAIRKSLEEALGGGLEDIIKDSTTKASKTLSQWSSEVAQIIQSALTIRRQKQVGLDGITKAWSDLRKKAEDARKAVKKAQDQINGLTANRGTLEYQLNIAIKYGDSKRAAELQAKLDENTTSLAEANDQLKEAQDAASTELKGNSDAAIENRSRLRSLVDTYVPYIQALENSTLKNETFAQKQDRVAKRVQALKKEFESQALALGFAQTDLAAYLGDFDAMGTVVKNMPNTVTVKVDGQPAALRALREFATSANAILSKVAPDASTLLANILTAEIAQKQAQLDGYSSLLKSSKSNSEKLRYVNIIDRIGAEIKTLKAEASTTAVKKAAGGYISGPGTATSDSIPAMLSNGEYVVKASTVRKVGVAALNDLNQNGSVARFADGGFVSPRVAEREKRGVRNLIDFLEDQFRTEKTELRPTLLPGGKLGPSKLVTTQWGMAPSFMPKDIAAITNFIKNIPTSLSAIARIPGEASAFINKHRAIKGLLAEKQIAINMPTSGIKSFIEQGKYKTVLENILDVDKKASTDYIASRQSLNEAAFGGQDVSYGYLTRKNPKPVVDFGEIRRSVFEKFSASKMVTGPHGITILDPAIRNSPRLLRAYNAKQERLAAQARNYGRSGREVIASATNPKGGDLSHYFGYRGDVDGKRVRSLGGTIFLKRGLAKRSTFTPGDSLGLSARDFADKSITTHFYKPIPLAKPSNDQIRETAQMFGKKGDYIEAQIFGGINLSDVKKILMETPEHADEVSKLLASKGIKIPVGVLKEVYRDASLFEKIMYGAAFKIKSTFQRLPSLDTIAELRRKKELDRQMEIWRKTQQLDWLKKNPGSTTKDYELYREKMAAASTGLASGGYVSGPGTGTSDSIPARLSNGEFVMSARSVSNYGVDFMNAMNQSRVMYAPAQPSMAQSSGGSSVVYLSPDDRALLRAAIDRPVNLYADSTRLAQSVNNGNKVLAQRGSI